MNPELEEKWEKIRRKHGVILFDGVCVFCNGAVKQIAARDSADYFRYAALQSEWGEFLKQKYAGKQQDTDSVVLVEQGNYYTQSTAAIHVMKSLDGLFFLSVFLFLIPRPLRDVAYMLFAKMRYRLFGKKDACEIPTGAMRNKFLF